MHGDLNAFTSFAAANIVGECWFQQETILCVIDHVVSYKQLRGGVEIIPEIPRSAAGKILRKELKEMAKSLIADMKTSSAAVMK